MKDRHNRFLVFLIAYTICCCVNGVFLCEMADACYIYALMIKHTFVLLGVFFLGICLSPSCVRPSKGNRDGKRPAFEPIAGIDFYETRRGFDNGLSFDTIGFQQEPIWHIRFTNNDSVKIHSLKGDSMLHYAIYYDHDSIFHFGREWFRVINLNRDSLMLQRLTVQHLRVKEARSNVYMQFYSDRFIRDSLKTRVDILRRPSARDSAFVRAMAKRANDNPSNFDSLFSARNPVKFSPKSDLITIKKREAEEGDALSKSAAYYYLYPEFDVVINRAYKDFSYSFSAFVDEKGKMTVAKFITSPEFEASRRKVLQGILDVYFHNLLEIKPGSTLGMPHNTLVMLHVRGTTEAKP